jgi:hypothetical protein
MHGLNDLGRQGGEQDLEIVDRFAVAVLGTHAGLH